MSALRSLAGRIGRRGCFLLFLAQLDLVYAYSLFNPPESARRSATMHFIAHLAPLPVWSAIWLVPGILCAIQAFMRNDRAAYAAAMGVKVLWGATYIAGAIVAHLERAYVGAVIWLAFAFFVVRIASWPEPAQQR